MSRATIARLRDFVPIRPLSREEALRIAELQATRLLEISGITSGPVPERIISDLPRIDVRRFSPLPISGATEWANSQWLVVINAAEPITRQRFSLAHEFKHILDHRFIEHLYQGVPERDRAAWTEQVCDYFAGCLLMPRPWVKRAWTTGTQHLPDLADRFEVSQAAMKVRLSQLGLTEPQPRCGRHDLSWHLAAARGKPTYARARSLVLT